MSTTITLPSPLRTRLSVLQRRIRLLRAVRGCALLTVVLGLSAAAAVFADYWFDLPALTRRILFRVWLGEGVALTLMCVVVPLCRRIDAASLAAILEERYPELDERLTSAVELAGTSEARHGSPIFIGLLVEETAERSRNLDIRSAAPARRVAGLAVVATATLFLLAAPALLYPRQYGERTQRFLQPWQVDPVAAPYDIAVSPGDVVAARGRALSLSAHIAPRDDKIALPDTVVLVVVDGNGAETRQAMRSDGDGDFTLAYKVPGDVSYRIEVGEIVGASYRVTAIDPVELAADSPRITIAPPAYARSAKAEETLNGLVDVSPLQHSEIRFDFRFTRPAAAGYIEWIAEDRTNNDGKTRVAETIDRQPLTLSEDRRAASLTFTAINEIKYRLVLEAEHGIRTELEGGVLRVQPDRPPSVARFGGKEELRTVLPTDVVPLEIEAADDIGVASVELEYRVDDDESERQLLEIEGGNTPSAVARHVLELAGKLRQDDRLHYRFHIRDNLPKKYHGPHVVVYPADRWLTLQAARRGDPLKQQEILAQRDEIDHRLQAIRASLLREKRGVYKVRQETRDESSLPPDQLEDVAQLQRDNRTGENALRGVAEIADASPPLQMIAERARAVTDLEMHESERALVQAPKQTHPAERTRQFDKVDEQLDSAVKRLDELKKANDRLARERLDRGKLETLADREKRLAEQAAELAAKHPVLDPKSQALAEKIERDQADVAADLEHLSRQSEPLKQALEQARAEQARKLAEQARELAQAQRDLARAEAETERQSRADRLAELARKQQELAEQQAKLAQQTQTAAPVAQTAALKPEESKNAAEALKQGNTPEALRHQEQAANDLERLAQAFERAIQVSADPKEAARQLEQAENALSQRVSDESKKNDKPLSERLKPLHEEQKAIRQEAERLSVPPDHAEANKLKQQIGERAAQATEALQKQDAAQAQARMDETKNLLHRLSDMLPNLEQRRRRAHREMERLRRQQEEIARQVEQLPKDDPSANKRLAEAARRQAESAKTLSKMDAPNREERRERTAEALRQALADLRDGRREDVPASQQEAKRQLERLDRALHGEKTADESARELARKQRELAEEARRADAANTPQQNRELQRKQQQLAEQTRNLPASDAPQRQRAAVDAVQRAAQAAQTQPTSAETQKQMGEAASKLEDLAQQLNGDESNAARAERLAHSQAEAAAESERRLGKAATPEEQRRQQEIAREASEVRGGDEARNEKQRLNEALARVQQSPAQEQAAAQRQAADALRDLADRLAGRDDSAAKSKHLAQQQRDLAREVAQTEPGNESQDSKRAAERQAELARRLKRLKAKEALPQILDTRARMADAVVALDRAKTPADAKKAVARAAESAEELAEQLGKTQTTNRRPQTSEQNQTTNKPSAPFAAPLGLPNREQSEQARQLARQQRELRDAVQQADQTARSDGPAARDNPVEDLVRQQKEVAKQAADLARRVAEEQGEKTPVARLASQARGTTQEAARQLSAGALPQARRAGEQSAEQLRQVASQLVLTPLGGDKQTPDVLQQARRLTQRQEQINRLLQPLANDARAQAAQQQSRQRELEQEAGAMTQQFQRASRKSAASASMQSALQRAGGNSQQAQQAMRQASAQAQRGESSAEKQSQERAAQALDEAGRALSTATPSSSASAAKPSAPKAGEAMTQAAQQMAAAQGQLSQGKPAQAQAAMKQAAQSLAQAAQQMAAAETPSSGQSDPSGKPSPSTGLGRQPGALPDLSAYGLDAAAYAGKGWGELPGELRTKIVQDMRTNYGDDYARTIKYYFEHLADTKKK